MSFLGTHRSLFASPSQHYVMPV